jgi:NAD(P)-dependent dehydrogenase (short-subunit alcohol dehydrogenase family)
MDLHGATVLITGSAGGIGSALAARCRQEGATVVGADLPGQGADIDVDVTDAAAVAEAVRAVADRHGRLDVVVANAGGGGRPGRVVDLDDADWDRAVDVTFHGTINTVRAAYPVLARAGSGSLVLMSSLAGLLGSPLLVPYAAAKHGVVGLAASLRPEAARVGVGVTVVCPGPVDTAMLDTSSATPGMSTRRYLTSALPMISPQRLADDIVAAVRSDEALVLPGRAKLFYRLQRLFPAFVASRLAKDLATELDLAATATATAAEGP